MKKVKNFYLIAPSLLLFMNVFAGMSWSAFAQSNPIHGPVTVDDRNKCPSGYSILDSNTAEDNGGAGFAVSSDVDVCIVNNQSRRNKGPGFDLRKQN